MIISVLTDPDVGGTFLTWSLHYLAGHDDYYSWNTNTFEKLISNPLTVADNAHNFKANKPITLVEFEGKINHLLSNQNTKFHTVYLHNLTETPKIFTSKSTDTTNAINQLYDITDKVIIIDIHQRNTLYEAKFTHRSLGLTIGSQTKIYKNFNEGHEAFIDFHYLDSKKIWQDLGMTNVWDHREFLALNLRPQNPLMSILPNVDLTKPHYRLDSFALYNHFDKTVSELTAWLGINIDPTRWDQWLTVYNQWRGFHLDRQLFVEYFDVIIDSIINGYYLDLRRFKWDIIREAVIQHELIYKHGLTIKGWGLEKFPDNAQDLHKLIEPNIYHEVEDIYGLLKRKSN